VILEKGNGLLDGRTGFEHPLGGITSGGLFSRIAMRPFLMSAGNPIKCDPFSVQTTLSPLIPTLADEDAAITLLPGGDEPDSMGGLVEILVVAEQHPIRIGQDEYCTGTNGS
jgi:hypothetical protein